MVLHHNNVFIRYLYKGCDIQWLFSVDKYEYLCIHSQSLNDKYDEMLNCVTI